MPGAGICHLLHDLEEVPGRLKRGPGLWREGHLAQVARSKRPGQGLNPFNDLGVIAVGDVLKECRMDLIEVIEEWIVARLQWGYPISPIGGQIIASSKEPIAVVD